MTQFEFAPAARLEIDRAAEEYEADYPGRGLRFYSSVETALRRLATSASIAQPFPGVPEHLGVRRLRIKHFPYVVAYRVLGDVIRIDAVIHTRRRAGYWTDRIR